MSSSVIIGSNQIATRSQGFLCQKLAGQTTSYANSGSKSPSFPRQLNETPPENLSFSFMMVMAHMTHSTLSLYHRNIMYYSTVSHLIPHICSSLSMLAFLVLFNVHGPIVVTRLWMIQGKRCPVKMLSSTTWMSDA